MMRNGILVTNDGRRVFVEEQGIKTFYDKNKKTLRNIIDKGNDNYYEVLYDSSVEGKSTLLNNFYTVKNVTKQQGVQPRVLTRRERNMEIWRFLNPQQSPNVNYK